MYAMLAIDLVDSYQHEKHNQAEAIFAHVADGFAQPYLDDIVL